MIIEARYVNHLHCATIDKYTIQIKFEQSLIYLYMYCATMDKYIKILKFERSLIYLYRFNWLKNVVSTKFDLIAIVHWAINPPPPLPHGCALSYVTTDIYYTVIVTSGVSKGRHWCILISSKCLIVDRCIFISSTQIPMSPALHLILRYNWLIIWLALNSWLSAQAHANPQNSY